MRFVCEICQTRYIIPDERARGRVLKVRCKKCGNVIILKAEPEAQEAQAQVGEAMLRRAAIAPGGQRSTDRVEEATQMVDAGLLRKLRDESQLSQFGPDLSHKVREEVADWHVILSGKQTGPVPMSALIEKMLGGEMTARSYVWRDGMAEWKRAEEVPDVARWLPAQPSPTPGPQRIPQPPAAKVAPRVEPAVRSVNAQSSAAAAVSAPRRAVVSSAEVADRFFDGEEASDDPAPALDPFAAVPDAPGLTHPKPGEVTKFFITQAGVAKTRSPWRITIYAGVGALLLVGGLVALSRLGIDVPLLPQTDAERQQRIFKGASGDSKMRALLYGKGQQALPHPNAGGPANAAGQRPLVQGPLDQGPLAKKQDQHVDQLGKSDKDELAQLYASQNLSPLRIKPSSAAGAPVIDRTDAPLTPEQVSRTVSRFQGGYAGCIERELKRNPNFQGGKIRIVTTIMSSGLVRQAQIESDDARLQRSVVGGALGTCLTDQTRRMVFPNFAGEPFDAEIPLVLQSSM